MEQNRINRLKELPKLIDKKEKEIKKLWNEIFKLTDECDHKYPDGISAVDKESKNQECSICDTECY